MQESKGQSPEELSLKTIGSLVADDYRIAEVFEKNNIDFCCGGNVTLRDACREKGVDPAAILRDIEEVKREPIERSQNFMAWELPFLADYIVNVHHAYINENTAQLAAYTQKIAEIHGSRHPEVKEIAVIFSKIAKDLIAHLREEEDFLFPKIKRVHEAKKAGKAPEQPDLNTIRDILEKLRREHEEVGDAIHTIRHLAKEYEIPADACNTYTVTYQRLKEFEDDLHKHVHLENNILFLKAEQL